jgi:hypothetical protein
MSALTIGTAIVWVVVATAAIGTIILVGVLWLAVFRAIVGAFQ